MSDPIYATFDHGVVRSIRTGLTNKIRT